MAVSDLDDLEQFADNVKLRPNKSVAVPHRGAKASTFLPPHGLVHREEAAHPKAAVRREPVETAVTPATVSKRNSANLGRLISDYGALLEAFRERAKELEISREGIDSIAGWADGYASKLLGGEAAKRRKIIGPLSLGLMLGTLGLKMILVEDPESTTRTLTRRTPVNRANQRFGNVCRISAKLLPKPAQPAPAPLLTIVGTKRPARRGKYG
jgi:hypothetical protein